jgi:hypothetical protein
MILQPGSSRTLRIFLTTSFGGGIDELDRLLFKLWGVHDWYSKFKNKRLIYYFWICSFL